MPNIGPTELAIVAIVALLVLGPKRLPSAGRSLGQGIREFKDGLTSRTTTAPELEDDGAAAA
jgi:sec-independent protein translocase protein TatA